MLAMESAVILNLPQVIVTKMLIYRKLRIIVKVKRQLVKSDNLQQPTNRNKRKFVTSDNS